MQSHFQMSGFLSILLGPQETFFSPTFLAMPVACGILVPWAGIGHTPSALEARNLNHWATREVPREPWIALFIRLSLSTQYLKSLSSVSPSAALP